jgi:hypothetical protein
LRRFNIAMICRPSGPSPTLGYNSGPIHVFPLFIHVPDLRVLFEEEP